MPLPALMSATLLPLGALAPMGPPPGGAPAAAGGAATGAATLSFTMQDQEQTQWCWSAVAVSVALFYDAGTAWSAQCGLAGAELSKACCPAGSDPTANVPWYLDLALQRAGRYNTWATGPATRGQIQTEIDADRPLGVRIGWNAGGGHFVIISAYAWTPTSEQVTVENPDGYTGQQTMDLADLTSNYQGAGTWTHSYWTI